MKLTQSEKIRIHAARNNLSMTKIYDALGISKQSGHYKLIGNRFTADELERIAEILNVSANELRRD